MFPALKTLRSEFSPTVTSALDMLQAEVYSSLPSAADAVVYCTDRIYEALRNRDTHALKSWVLREKYPASDMEILAIFDAVASAVARQAGDVKKTRRMLQFLNDVRVTVSSDLRARESAQRVDEMFAPSTHDVVEALLSAVEAYDPDTADHLRATAMLARRIADTMLLEPQQIVNCELAALLHDIGKIAIPIGVLQKPGALTDTEWTVMREHPGTGADMLQRVAKLRHIAHIVRSHHERMDGCGYPDRLRGADIPLEARVVAVADAFHAMVTKRSYREAISAKAALDILHENRDTQFDGTVVDAICESFNYVPQAAVHRASNSVLRRA